MIPISLQLYGYTQTQSLELLGLVKGMVLPLYPSYNEECRNMILHFLHKHFPDRDGLVRPIEPLQCSISSIARNIPLSSTLPKLEFTAVPNILIVGLRLNLPATIELGRSFVRTEYQSSREGIKSIYVLDNLWDGPRSRHGIEFVDVAILSCSAAGAAECDFPQTPDFAHGIGA